jgi:hypothetical protein
MTRNRIRLFYWLAIIGALSGYLLGEMILGTGNGLYVAPVAAIVGLLLAWSLDYTRRAEVPPGVSGLPDDRSAAGTPERQRKTTNSVRVVKSQGGRKR